MEEGSVPLVFADQGPRTQPDLPIGYWVPVHNKTIYVYVILILTYHYHEGTGLNAYM
jgi:hypothetical protein